MQTPDDIDTYYSDPRPYLGPCDCHLRSRSTLGEGRCASGDLPDPNCPKCHGEGDLFGKAGAA